RECQFCPICGYRFSAETADTAPTRHTEARSARRHRLVPPTKYLQESATGNCERTAAFADGRRYPHSGEARDAAVCSFARITMVEGAGSRSPCGRNARQF